MATVETQRVIAAPAHRVWQVFTDIRGSVNAVGAISSVEVLSDGPFGPGYRWRETRTMFGRAATEEMWVTDAEEPRSYEVAASSHGTDYLSSYTFEEVSGGTRVTLTFSGKPHSLVAKAMNLLTGWLAKGTVVKMFQQDLEDLAEVCERA